MKTCALLSILLALAPRAFAEGRYPLGPGMRWVYSESRVEGDPKTIESSVEESLGGGLYRMRSSAGGDTLVQVEGEKVYSVVEGPGGTARTLILDFGRSPGDSWDVPCDGTVTLESVSERVTVPAGTFEGCHVFRTEIRCLGILGPARAWYAPGVGRVKSEAVSPSGTVTQELARFEPPAPFLRGDTNDDDKADLSDAVFMLRWLFLGEPPPACEETADTDGSGETDITDAVYLLRHLFTGGDAPPAPFPECGRPDLYSSRCAAGECG